MTDHEESTLPVGGMRKKPTAGAEERALIDYLLGRMPEEQRAELENRLFLDEALDEALLATTDDLIDEYLRGRLKEEERRRFENYFLSSPEHRRRLEWMKGLLSVIGRRPAPSRRPARPVLPMLAAAAGLAAVAALVATRDPHRPRAAQTVMAPTPMPTTRPSNETGQPSLAPPLRSSPNPVHTVRLARGATAPVTVTLAAETRTVRLEVTVDGDSPSYDAMIRTADGREVWRAEGLVPRSAGAPLTLSVPSRLLRASAYALRVEGEVLRDGPAVTFEYPLRVIHEN